MSVLSDARLCVYEALTQSEQRGEYVKKTLERTFKNCSLTPSDKAFAMRLGVGACATKVYMHELIDEFKHKGTYISPDIKRVLGISLHELLYMNSSEYAVIDQGVHLAHRIDPYSNSLVNALLRAVAREVKPVVASLRKKDSSELTLKELQMLSGLPLWVAKKIKKSLPKEFHEVLAHNLNDVNIYASFDPNKFIQQQAQVLLLGEGIESETTELPYTLNLKNTANISSCASIKNDTFLVSDKHAQLVCMLAQPEPDWLVLEIGQGRATKTLFFERLSAYQEKPAVIVGVDCFEYKTHVAQKRLHEWQNTTISVTYDAQKLTHKFAPHCVQYEFDLVFCDMPCSGTGTMRRHPEIVSTLTPSAFDRTNPDSLVSLQKNILQEAVAKVKSGGYLAYSTCSIMQEENARQIQDFLASDLGQAFEVVSISDIAFARDFSDEAYEYVCRFETEQGYLQTYPGKDGADGHFLCMLKRL